MIWLLVVPFYIVGCLGFYGLSNVFSITHDLNNEEYFVTTLLWPVWLFAGILWSLFWFVTRFVPVTINVLKIVWKNK